MDYRFSLNLPFSEFPMKANLIKIEPFLINFWARQVLNKKDSLKKNIFVLNDGPPYANGDIHIGHAFNKILKDIIIKFKKLNGCYVYFIPGWDCHGLPIELNVEKNLSKVISFNKDFRLLCKKYAFQQINIQKKSFIKLGIFTNWNNFYTTMDKIFELSIVDSFYKMLENNFIYYGNRPIYWCFNCKSALAEAEVEYESKESDSIYVFFILKKGELYNYLVFNYTSLIFGFLIWTTTPWTIPFNEAVAIKPNSIYVLLETNNRCYIISYNILNELLNKILFVDYNIIMFVNSCVFENSFVLHPIFLDEKPIVFGEHVKITSGTGNVHIAPAYGYDDYKIALNYNLPIINFIDDNGFSYNNVKFFSLMYLDDINFKVIKMLFDNKNLIFKEKIYHRYPYCWRHKSKLIFRTTKQLFFDFNQKKFKSDIFNFTKNKIMWVPNVGKYKMLSMFKDRPDWCISRQRSWGVPLILFVDKNYIIHPNIKNIIINSLFLIKEYGTDFWYKLDIFNILNIDINNYSKIPDVLDVWFDSSVVYKYNFELSRVNLPFDLCIEGTDQYRGWFQVSLINSISNYGSIPYKTILSHGFILDKFGRKMSKSLNNVVTPHDIISKYSVDILRLWVASVNYSFDINISDEILMRISEAYRKIRNTFKFFLSNLFDVNCDYFCKINLKFLYIDIWVLYKFQIFKNVILKNYSEYKTYFVYKKSYNFYVDDLCCKYLDMIKDRLYVGKYNSISRISSQFVLFFLCYNLSKLLAPVLSFTAEEIWAYLPFKDEFSIFSSKFKINFKLNKFKFNVNIYILLNKLFFLKNLINKFIEDFRNNVNFGSSLELKLNFFCNIYWYNIFFNVKDEINRFFIVSEIAFFICESYLVNDLHLVIDGLYLKIENLIAKKCERCWNKIKVDFKFNINICERCISILYYIDEERYFV